MISSRGLSFLIPFRDKLTDESGFLNQTWTSFFRTLHQMTDSIGIESYSEITNNQTTPKTIDGLSLNSDNFNYVIVDYFIQRITTGAGAQELLEQGVLYCVYKPITATWIISSPATPWPSNAGVTFSITSSGAVQYTSTNITGTPSRSKITYRARTFAAKI